MGGDWRRVPRHAGPNTFGSRYPAELTPAAVDSEAMGASATRPHPASPGAEAAMRRHGLDPEDPSGWARAIAMGLVDSDPPYVPSPWP